jgi:hypothetical protein
MCSPPRHLEQIEAALEKQASGADDRTSTEEES